MLANLVSLWWIWALFKACSYAGGSWTVMFSILTFMNCIGLAFTLDWDSSTVYVVFKSVIISFNSFLFNLCFFLILLSDLEGRLAVLLLRRSFFISWRVLWSYALTDVFDSAASVLFLVTFFDMFSYLVVLPVAFCFWVWFLLVFAVTVWFLVAFTVVFLVRLAVVLDWEEEVLLATAVTLALAVLFATTTVWCNPFLSSWTSFLASSISFYICCYFLIFSAFFLSCSIFSYFSNSSCFFFTSWSLRYYSSYSFFSYAFFLFSLSTRSFSFSFCNSETLSSSSFTNFSSSLWAY